jgi:ppGpp synthetase/RelA/SpoT-type nucleotidyltranferase
MYDAFAVLIASRLRAALQAKGIWCDVTARAKELHSLVKKLLKGHHTYENLPDKAGVRCIVRYRSEIDQALSIARGLFDCSEPDRKEVELAADRVGYSSTHVEVKLISGDPEAIRYSPTTYWSELQIRTLGQHLWAEISHDAVYKNEETLAVLPADLRRRVNLMSGLIEVADREFDRMDGELRLTEEARLYKGLERNYYKLTARRPDPQVSLEVIGLLAPLYGNAETSAIGRMIDEFFASHESTLQSVFAQAHESEVSAFFYQPEVLMIYERLEADQIAVRTLWNTRFPETELESIANAFGISFD